MPFKVFLEIIDTKNLQLLVLYGEPPKEELQKAWESLQDAYSNSLQEGESPEKAEIKDLTINQSKVTRALVSLEALRKVGPNKALLSGLFTFGYNLPELTEDNTDFVIKQFTANFKRDYVDLQIAAKEYQDQTEDDKPVDSNYYLDTIALIMTGLKCPVDINTLTLGMYIALIKQYKQYLKNLLKQQADVRSQ